MGPVLVPGVFPVQSTHSSQAYADVTRKPEQTMLLHNKHTISKPYTLKVFENTATHAVYK